VKFKGGAAAVIVAAMSSKKQKHSARRKPSKSTPKRTDAEPVVEAESVPAPEPVQENYLERFPEPDAEVAREAAAEIDGPDESAHDCKIHWIWRLSAWLAGV
jgi:hypothetical protein